MSYILEVLACLFIAHGSQTLLELVDLNAHEQLLELILFFTLLRGILCIAKVSKVVVTFVLQLTIVIILGFLLIVLIRSFNE